MHYFITYDITNDRLRLRISKLLERHGCCRVQRSVFFADHFLPKEITRLRKELEQELLTHDGDPTDSVLCVPLERDYLDDVCWLGCPSSIENVGKKPKFLLV